jgi:hypothetical protein
MAEKRRLMYWYLVPGLRKGDKWIVPGARAEMSVHLVSLDMTFLVIFCG